jgi:hypothetical protein
MDERPPRPHAPEKLFILRVESRVVRDLDLDSGVAENADAFAVHPRIRVEVSDDDTLDPGLQNRLRARRAGGEMVAIAWFEGDVHRRASGFAARFFEGHRFGVVGAGPDVPSLAYDGVAAHDGCAHEWVWGCCETPAFGKIAGEIHKGIP